MCSFISDFTVVVSLPQLLLLPMMIFLLLLPFFIDAAPVCGDVVFVSGC